ncbi:hypothetical protein D3C72_1778650 [compost metagenome]
MTGDDGRRGAAFGQPGTPGGHASHQHHRLCIGGERKLFLGTVLDQCTDVFAQRFGGFTQGLGHGRVIAPGVEHADRLRALTRKDKSKGFHCCFFVTAPTPAPGRRDALQIQ